MTRMVLTAALLLAGALATVPELRAQQNTAAMAKRGESIWQKKRCAACHGIARVHSGPDLAGVAQRRSREWLYRWMKESEKMLLDDPIAAALMAEYNNVPMPSYKLSQKDTDDLLAYIEREEALVRRTWQQP